MLSGHPIVTSGLPLQSLKNRLERPIFLSRKANRFERALAEALLGRGPPWAEATNRPGLFPSV